MKYVLDSSVAFKWEVAEADADKAIRLRDESRRGLHELLAPDVFPVEVAHAMTRAERQGRVSPADGWRLWLGIIMVGAGAFLVLYAKEEAESSGPKPHPPAAAANPIAPST